MPCSDNQKARLFALYQILYQYTDETHAITMNDILEKLNTLYEIETTRKTIADDFAILDLALNMPVKESDTRPKRYSLEKRILSFEDLELIFNSIQANTSVPLERKRELWKKLRSLSSIHQKSRLTMKTDCAETIQGLDQKTLEKIKTINKAIAENNCLHIKYCHYTFSKQACPVREVVSTKVLPIEVFYGGGTYYLFAYGREPDTRFFIPREIAPEYFHIFKIAKIEWLGILDKEKKLPPPAEIPQKPYPLFGGKREKVSLQFSKDLLSIVYDRLGTDIEIDRITDSTFRVAAEVEVSPEFFGWLFRMGTGAKVLTPLHVAQRMKKWAKDVAEMYGVLQSSQE